MGTAAAESDMGSFLAQTPGPALGIYQMEPFTYDCIYNNFLVYRPLLSQKIAKLYMPTLGVEQLAGNLFYATAMARLKYLRSPRALPRKEDIDGLALTWKLDYNTKDGAGTVEKFKEKYNKYVLPYLED